MFRNQELESRSDDEFDESYSDNFQMTKSGTKQKSQRSKSRKSARSIGRSSASGSVHFGMTDADENAILKSQLKDMRDSFGNGYSDPQRELIEFNKEMQWTLI